MERNIFRLSVSQATVGEGPIEKVESRQADRSSKPADGRQGNEGRWQGITMKVRRAVQIFVLTALLLSLPAASFAQISIGVAVNIAPPALPVYDQPICPGANYIWTPGYWAWNGYDYYWVPGTWVMAPTVGLLWTPG